MELISTGYHIISLLGPAMMMGILNWKGSDDGGEFEDGGGMTADNDLFGDTDSSVEFDDAEMDDWGGGGDEADAFGDFDDGDADFGGGVGGAGAGGGTQAVQELENRVDDIEADVDDMSSTIKTVRKENEEIASSVEGIEDNVRKLLDIYEMVTRGVNPFVGEVKSDGPTFDGEDDFGLFDTTDGESEDLNSDVLDADAESFFDDSAFDDDGGDDEEFDLDLDFDEEEDVEADGEAEEFDLDVSDADDNETDGESDASFQDLKNEYDSGDAEWQDDESLENLDLTIDEDADEDDEFDLGLDLDEPEDDVEDVLGETESEEDEDEDGFDGAKDESAELLATDTADSSGEDLGSALEGMNEEPETNKGEDLLGDDLDAVDPVDDDFEDFGFDTADNETDESAEATDESTKEVSQSAEPSGETKNESADDDPYLMEIPDGYLMDLVVMEWLDYLITEFGAGNAVRAIDHYEQIGWISPAARDHLLTYLEGLSEVDVDVSNATGPGQMDINDHIRSLTFIGQLSGDSAEQLIVENSAQIRGEGYGLQC